MCQLSPKGLKGEESVRGVCRWVGVHPPPGWGRGRETGQAVSIPWSALASDSHPGPRPPAKKRREGALLMPGPFSTMLCAHGNGECSLLPVSDSSGSKRNPGLLHSSPEALQKLRSEAVLWRMTGSCLSRLVEWEEAGPGTRRGFCQAFAV